MRVVEVAKHSIEQLKIFERRFVIKLNQRQVAHERRSVQAINDVLDLSCAKGWGLCE
jgi:hypothetical protein